MQGELTVFRDGVQAEAFWWPWKSYRRGSEPPKTGVLKYTVNIPKHVDAKGDRKPLIVTNKEPFARGMSKCCYNGKIGDQLCAILIEPLNVPTLNEDVNDTVFIQNSVERGGPFRDAIPTTNNNVIEECRIMSEITEHEPNLLPTLFFMGVCTGSVDLASLNDNYAQDVVNEVREKMGDKYRAETHGPDALKATQFAVQICEKYEMSLKEYTNEYRPPSQVATILTKIAMLTTQLNMRGFDHDDLHSGNIVINTSTPMVRFIDLGLRKTLKPFEDLYDEYIKGTELAEHVTVVDIIQRAMDGRDTANNDLVQRQLVLSPHDATRSMAASTPPSLLSSRIASPRS